MHSTDIREMAGSIPALPTDNDETMIDVYEWIRDIAWIKNIRRNRMQKEYTLFCFESYDNFLKYNMQDFDKFLDFCDTYLVKKVRDKYGDQGWSPRSAVQERKLETLRP